MKVVITGGCGFVGSVLVSQLSRNKNFEITSVESRLPLERETDITIADINNMENLMNIATLRLKESDILCHLSGYVDDDVRSHPYQGFTTNVQGTLNVLEVMRRLDIKKILFASTFLVYDGLGGEVYENSKIDLDAIGLYAKSKLAGEWLIKEFSKKYGIQYVVFRFGSVYGEAERCSNLIKDFVRAAIANEQIIIWGRGDSRRPLTHVEDLASGIISGINASNETFNLVSDEHPSTNEIINILRKENPNLEVVYDETKREKSYPIISCRKAREMLGWEHKSRFEDNLRRIYRQLQADSHSQSKCS